MGFWDDLFGDKLKWAATQASHRKEISSLEATIKQKDATIEKKDATIEGLKDHSEFLRERLGVAETARQSLSDSVQLLQTDITKFDPNHPPTVKLIDGTTASVSMALVSSEKLGSTLDEMSEAVHQARGWLNQPAQGTLLGDFKPAKGALGLLGDLEDDEDQ